MSLHNKSVFKNEFDKLFNELLKEAMVPEPLPEEITEISPWDEDKEKTIGGMNKGELANFIYNLDEATFNELKEVLEKIEMPKADDMDELVDEVLGPEKTVDEAMEGLKPVNRDNFLKKLRLSKRN